jgi:plasmid replication initiation protein
MEVIFDKNNLNLVTKHKDLLNSRYRLNPLSLKIIAILVSMIGKNDKDFQEYHINVSDFKEMTGTNSKRIHEYIKKSSEELLASPLHIKLDDGDWLKVNWIASARYKKGVMVYKISPDLKPYLLDLQNRFLQYDLNNTLYLQGSYVIRLYELLKDTYNEQSSFKSEVIANIDIDWIRDIFEIPETYKYSHLKKNIIENAQSQFKEFTDITFSFKENKDIRKVTSIDFKIKDNKRKINFLSSKLVFISYLRKNYVNKLIIKSKDKHSGKILSLSINPDGKIYDQHGTDFNHLRADEIYLNLFELAKSNKTFWKQLSDKKENSL